ncbi:hypothetical protein QDX21_07055 [Auritidibacter ignavus]|uniref:Major tail protein n=1 Tax=Auritidibacter ignavus TaxID=678932 RepID=A0AAJ6AJL9_9MICC|nr:hypothetical protein [Auritidibacter ignavus]WGH92093.1 hypothetical protein QDX21_07055 [Auritidibacter ignavus]
MSETTFENTGNNEALRSLLARRWAVEVQKIGSTDNWVRVRGINSLTPGLDPNFEDTTDFDNDGWSSSEKTLQGWSLAIGYIEKVGAESNVQDPGQAILENASDKFGDASLIKVRWFERGGERAYQGVAAVQYEPQGGGTSDLGTVNVTLNGNGKREPITHPGGGTGN